MSDRIIVMYLGRICEVGSANDLFEHPRHPYTEALVAAIPASRRTRDDQVARCDPRSVPAPAGLPVPHALSGGDRTVRLGGRRPSPLPGGTRARARGALRTCSDGRPSTPTSCSGPATRRRPWRQTCRPNARAPRCVARSWSSARTGRSCGSASSGSRSRAPRDRARPRDRLHPAYRRFGGADRELVRSRRERDLSAALPAVGAPSSSPGRPIVFRRTPTPSISSSITSPGCSFLYSSSPGRDPPCRSRSPGPERPARPWRRTRRSPRRST